MKMLLRLAGLFWTTAWLLTVPRFSSAPSESETSAIRRKEAKRLAGLFWTAAGSLTVPRYSYGVGNFSDSREGSEVLKCFTYRWHLGTRCCHCPPSQPWRPEIEATALRRSRNCA